jgi:hypothetical protein
MGWGQGTHGLLCGSPEPPGGQLSFEARETFTGNHVAWGEPLTPCALNEIQLALGVHGLPTHEVHHPQIEDIQEKKLYPYK